MTTPPTFHLASLLVLLGGAVGSWLRYMTGRAWGVLVGPAMASAFPWATLTANVLGSLAMGLLTGWLARRAPLAGFWSGEHWRLLLAVGVLGGYTTFSSFTLELALLLDRGQGGLAALYLGVSLMAGIGALFLGLYAMRLLG